MHKTPQTHLSQRDLSNLSKVKFRQDLPSPEFRHSVRSATGPLITADVWVFSLSHWEEERKLQQNAGIMYLPGTLVTCLGHTATELVTPFQAVPSCFFGDVTFQYGYYWLIIFNSPYKGPGHIFFLLQCPGVTLEDEKLSGFLP